MKNTLPGKTGIPYPTFARLKPDPILLGSMLAALMLSPALLAQNQRSIDQFSLEDLLDMEITSVSRTEQELAGTAAAVFILTTEDIRKSGMSSLPELLRLVPGLNVMNIDANKWAISSRGFNGRWSNKLQVLIDGRSVYTPIFSGVYWDIQDVVLADIERIEVIRGPGAAVWGSNAVNGVINIITRHTRDTQGTELDVVTGNQERIYSVRHGQALGENAWIRAYAKRSDRDNFDTVMGDGKLFDAWDLKRAGVRVDWEPSDKDHFLFQADHHHGKAGQETVFQEDLFSPSIFLKDTAKTSGSSIQLTWSREVSERSSWEINSYFYRNDRSEYGVSRSVHTFDNDFVHRFMLGESNNISWGLGYREVNDKQGGNYTVSFNPVERVLDQYTAFVQDQIDLNDQLDLTLGVKLEETYFSGFEYQPSARLSWEIREQQYVWAGVSRVVRAPSRSDTDLRLNLSSFSSPFVDPDGPGPLAPGDTVLVSIVGNPQMEAENLLAYEAGFRGRITDRLNLDIAGFYNDYSDLRTNTAGMPMLETNGLPPHLLIPLYSNNDEAAESWGVEATVTWQVRDTMRVLASHSYLNVSIDSVAPLDPVGQERLTAEEKSAPAHQTQIRFLWDLSAAINLNVNLFHQSSTVHRAPSGLIEMGSFSRVDAGLHWQLTDNVKASLVGQNLFDPSHTEFHTVDLLSGAVPRSFFINLDIAF